MGYKYKLIIIVSQETFCEVRQWQSATIINKPQSFTYENMTVLDALEEFKESGEWQILTIHTEWQLIKVPTNYTR